MAVRAVSIPLFLLLGTENPARLQDFARGLI